MIFTLTEWVCEQKLYYVVIYFKNQRIGSYIKAKNDLHQLFIWTFCSWNFFALFVSTKKKLFFFTIFFNVFFSALFNFVVTKLKIFIINFSHSIDFHLHFKPFEFILNYIRNSVNHRKWNGMHISLPLSNKFERMMEKNEKKICKLQTVCVI